MMHLAPLILLAMVSALGVVGNLLIIGSICLYKRLRVRGNVFIVNLAVADLIIVSYIMPVGLATSQYMSNPFSQVMCDINAFLTITSCGVSTQTLMLIALERYFHICKMHIYRRAFTPRLIALYVCIIWVYTCAWTCQGWTGWTKYVYGEHVYVCIFSGPMSISYDVCLAFFGMVLPMIIVSVCYYKIFRTVVRSRRAISAHRKKVDSRVTSPGAAADGERGGRVTSQLTSPESEKQTAREYRLIITLFTIVVIFAVCWLPACLVIVLSGLWKDMPRILNKIFLWLALSNSSFNSMVYGVLNKHFRNGYKHVFVRLCCYCENCCRSDTKNQKRLSKELYAISIWLALCNSGMNSLIYGILNKNFRTGYKQLLQHVFCCVFSDGQFRCCHCQRLIEDKDDSSSNTHSKMSGPRSTKTSTGPSSRSNSECNAASAKEAPMEIEDLVVNDSQMLSPSANKYEANTSDIPYRLRPIKYEEEPPAGTPLKLTNGTHLTSITGTTTTDGRMSLVHVDNHQRSPPPLANSSNGFFSSNTSQTGSQSSLIRRSIHSDSCSTIGYSNPYRIDTPSSTDRSASISRPASREPPPLSVARPRPTSGNKEASMTSVVLETKL